VATTLRVMTRRLGFAAALALFANVGCTSNNGEAVIDTAGAPGAMCGDGIVEAEEECDGDDNCTDQCTEHRCGDGILGPGESCDDANEEDGDACNTSCELGPAAIVDVSLGEFHTCALSMDGRVKCWGSNDLGRLGQVGYDEHIGDDEPPSDWDPIDVADDVVALVSGYDHNCALRSSGNVVCWGSGHSLATGYGTGEHIGDDESPSSVGDIMLSGIDTITAGNAHTCALADGQVYCWGLDNSGQLGYGEATSSVEGDTPMTRGAVPLDGTVVELTAGQYHTCARMDSGDVTCWGSNASGQLGTGNPDNIGDDEPASAAGPIDLGGKAVDIDAFWDTTCAVLDDGGVRCWGSNNSGVLGNGDEQQMSIGDRKTPAEEGVVQFEGTAVAVEVGKDHTCVLADDARVHCWGDDDNVGYDDDEFVSVRAPGAAASIGADVTKIVSGLEHVCAIVATGGVRCWGSNTGGMLGYPDVSSNTIKTVPSENGDVDVF